VSSRARFGLSMLRLPLNRPTAGPRSTPSPMSVPLAGEQRPSASASLALPDSILPPSGDVIRLTARRPQSPLSAGRRGRWTWLLVALFAVAVASGLMLALTVSTEASPSDTVAARTRDEDVRPERFLPPAAALVGSLGVIWAVRRGDERRRRWFAIGRRCSPRGSRSGHSSYRAAPAESPAFARRPGVRRRRPSPGPRRRLRHHHLPWRAPTAPLSRRASRWRWRHSASQAPYPANVQFGAKAYAVLYILATLVAAGSWVGRWRSSRRGARWIIAVCRALRLAGDVGRVRGRRWPC